MKLQYYQYLELAGLFIVLFSTMVQLIFLSTAIDISTDVAFYRIEEKLYIIRAEMNDIANRTSANETQLESDWWQVGDEGKLVNNQKSLFNNLYAISMTLGSSLLLYSRWANMRQTKT